MPGEPLDQFRGQLDPGACRLVNLPGRIWLFGGPGKFRLNQTPEPSASLRESFWLQSLNSCPSPDRKWVRDLDIPENHAEWWAFSGYEDLLTFERDACHLARAIVLFPESPGSLAELGALAVDETIISRLLVVVQSKYLETDKRESFLNLGPLKKVDNLRHRCVIDTDSIRELPTDDFDIIMDFIDDNLPQMHNTEKLRVDQPTHKLLFIADLADLLLVCKTDELLTTLHNFGLSISDSELERATKLLDFFELIRIYHRGNEKFFARRKSADQTWVNYTARNGKPAFDRTRFKTEREASLNTRALSILRRTP